MRKPKSTAVSKVVKTHFATVKTKKGPKVVIVKGHFAKKPKKH